MRNLISNKIAWSLGAKSLGIAYKYKTDQITRLLSTGHSVWAEGASEGSVSEDACAAGGEPVRNGADARERVLHVREEKLPASSAA